MSTQHTPTPNDSILHAAQGNLSFLLSVIQLGGEKLHSDEEANVRHIIEELGKHEIEERETAVERDRLRAFSLEAYLARAIAFSSRAFGPGKRTEGICKHIVKELNEIRQAPDDLEEWIDVMILSADGFWRAGGKPEQLAPMLFAKLAKNEARRWPQTTSEDAPVEHVREPEAAEQ